MIATIARSCSEETALDNLVVLKFAPRNLSAEEDELFRGPTKQSTSKDKGVLVGMATRSVISLYGRVYSATECSGGQQCLRHGIATMPGLDSSLRSRLRASDKCSTFNQQPPSARGSGSVMKGIPMVLHSASESQSSPHSTRYSDSDCSLPVRSLTKISTVTALLHARDFTKIIQTVGTVLPDGPEEEVLPLLFILGLAHFKLSDHKKGGHYLKQCEEVARSCSRRGDLSLCNIYLGDIDFSSQHYPEAAAHYKVATESYSTDNVANLFRMIPPSLSTLYAKCGSALRNASKMVSAVHQYKMAIEHATMDKERLAANTSLGNLYQSLGENKSALAHYENSIELSKSLNDNVSLGWAHGNLGNAFLGLFQKDKALYHLQKSLDLTLEHEPTPQAIGRTYNNLGTAYQSLGELDKAYEQYERALSQAIYGNDIPGQARVYGNKGNVLMLRKEYEEAIKHYTEVLRLSKDRSTLSTAYHNRGCAYYEWAENKMEALFKGHTTVEYFLYGPNFTDVTSQHYPRTVIDEVTDLYRKGSADLREVVKYHEGNLENIKGSSDGLTLSVSLFEANSRTFHRLQDCLVNLGKYTEALLVAEQSRARTLGELLLYRKGWNLALPLTPPLSLEQIKDSVGSALHPVLYFSYTGARLLGWVLVPRKNGTGTAGDVKMNMFEVPLKDDQFDGKSLDYHLRYSLNEALVERSFEMYSGVGSDEDSSKPVKSLYELIAKPFLHILRESSDITKISKVVIVSDSYTALVPYSSLRNSRNGGSFLGDKFSFQLMPSLLTMGILNQLHNANEVRLPEDTGNMCVVGNPHIPPFTYNKEVWHLGKLPHARREAEWVAHILKTTPILEEQATKSAILMKILSAKVIHLATHGNAAVGFLAFGAIGSSTTEVIESKQVLMYPEDVEKLNISPALVVLSSCDSGRGTVKADGIQGMARAFILAGAQAVLTTLWRVPDESAAIFMQFFYQYMMDGLESTRALQKSIFSIRCFAKYSQYIHWSGYQLTGRAVSFKNHTLSSTHLLKHHLGPGNAFPRLQAVKALESALVESSHCPTDVQILSGCPGILPSEIATDFIHNSHRHFKGGIFWICCRHQELVSASVDYIEKCVDQKLEHFCAGEGSPILVVFDGLTELPGFNTPLHQLMKHTHIHFIVVVHKEFWSPNQLKQDIDRQFLRGCKEHRVETLSRIQSTQRTVYTIQTELDLAPDHRDQKILDQLSDFSNGSPVLVDATAQLLLAHLRDGPCDYHSDNVGDDDDAGLHRAVERFSDSIALNTTGQGHGEIGALITRDISSEVTEDIPSLSVSPGREERGGDVWGTSCSYDSWNSIHHLLRGYKLEPEMEVLLNSLSIFGCIPVPVSLATYISLCLTKSSDNPHLVGSMVTTLVRMGLLKKYPPPVVLYPAIMEPQHDGEDFVCVPQCVADFLWKALNARDKVAAFTTCHYAISTLPPSQKSQFLLAITPFFIDSVGMNSDIMSKSCFQGAYQLYHQLLKETDREQ